MVYLDRGRVFYSVLRDSPVHVERQGVASDHLGSCFDVLHSVHYFSCCEIQDEKSESQGNSVKALQSAQKSSVLDLKAIVLLTVLCASWGLQQVTIKIANQGVSPILQSGIRSVGAAILVWIWMTACREPLFKKDGTLWWGIGIGFLFSGEFILIYWGLVFTNASRAVIFLYMSPFVVALGSQFFIPGEHLRKIQIMGLCCAFTGIVIAFWESLSFPTYKMLIGDCMLAIAAVLWGAVTVMIKASPLAGIGHSKTLLYQLGVSALVLPAASIVMNERGIVLMTPLIALCLAYQAVWVAFITYLVWFWLIRHYPVSRIASFTFLTPIFGVLAGGLLLNEPVSKSLLLALLLVGTGIYLVNRPDVNHASEQ
ncbi:MAG: DMT family transporter [Desulfobacteraceae bacterium]|nr:MAG: DMT family transporter [Desulfobacteraceae bacterium]